MCSHFPLLYPQIAQPAGGGCCCVRGLPPPLLVIKMQNILQHLGGNKGIQGAAWVFPG